MKAPQFLLYDYTTGETLAEGGERTINAAYDRAVAIDGYDDSTLAIIPAECINIDTRGEEVSYA